MVVFTYCFISLITLSKFSQCFKVLSFNTETVFQLTLQIEHIHFLYFKNGLRRETKLSVEINFTSFVFINIQNVASGYTLCHLENWFLHLYISLKSFHGRAYYPR